VALLGATLAALVWANLPGSDSYESVWTTELAIRLGDGGISLSLREWVNEGLMTFFFLVVGLEAKRELDIGQLRERRRIAGLALMALGGMACAVAIYLAFNAGGEGAHGWGAAMSTDTAFALGVLALVAPGGTRLRVRLLTLAVVDDIAALLVIATVYTEDVDLVALLVALALFAAIIALRSAPSMWRRPATVLTGVGLWVAMHESGIDPVISGLAVGLVLSAYQPARTDLEPRRASTSATPRLPPSSGRRSTAATKLPADSPSRCASVAWAGTAICPTTAPTETSPRWRSTGTSRTRTS